MVSLSDQLLSRMEAFKFDSPTSVAVYAPPSSGKSTLTRKILENADELFTIPPEFVVYCYKEWLPMLDEMKQTVRGFITHQGVPTREELDQWTTGKHFILVLDDLQQSCQNDKDVAEMFTVGSHHRNFTIMYLCHNIFAKGNFSRTINLNSHYLVLFRNNRDTQQVQTLGRQIFGKKTTYFLDAYHKATAQRFGYLVINLHPQDRRDEYKLVSKITPEDYTIVYLPRS